jgi:hypothetical protein
MDGFAYKPTMKHTDGAAHVINPNPSPYGAILKGETTGHSFSGWLRNRVVCILSILFGFGMVTTLHATEPVRADEASLTGTPERLAVPTNLWFHIGEELVYRIYWGNVPVGSTRITTQWALEDQRKLIVIRYRTLSNKIIDTLYPVDDTIETYVDPVTFLPVRFVKRLNEGRHRYHEVTTFDYSNRVAHWESLIKKKTKTFALESDTRDLVSFMYLLRSVPFHPDSSHQYRVMADDKTYDLWVKIAGPEPVRLNTFGAVNSLRFDPEAAFEGIFVRKGKLTAWVSTDDRRLCTRMVGSVPVASINVLLTEVYGPGNDFWTQTTRQKIDAGEIKPLEFPVEPSKSRTQKH